MELGVRRFDVSLHLNKHNGGLTAFHSHYYLHKDFNDLLSAGLDFLHANPTETIIFMIKLEYSSEIQLQLHPWRPHPPRQGASPAVARGVMGNGRTPLSITRP